MSRSIESQMDGLMECVLGVPLSMVQGDEYQAECDTKWQSR